MLRLAALVLLATTCNATLPAASVTLRQPQFSPETQRYSRPWKSDAGAEEKGTRFVNQNTETAASIFTDTTHDKETRFIYRPNIESSMSASTEIETQSVKQDSEISKDSPAEKEARFMKQNSKTLIKVPTISHAEKEMRFMKQNSAKEKRSLKYNTEKPMKVSTDFPSPEEARIPRLSTPSPLRKVPTPSQLFKVHNLSKILKVSTPSQFLKVPAPSQLFKVPTPSQLLKAPTPSQISRAMRGFERFQMQALNRTNRNGRGATRGE